MRSAGEDARTTAGLETGATIGGWRYGRRLAVRFPAGREKYGLAFAQWKEGMAKASPLPSRVQALPNRESRDCLSSLLP